MPEIVNNSVRVFELIRTRQARRESDSISSDVYLGSHRKRFTNHLVNSSYSTPLSSCRIPRGCMDPTILKELLQSSKVAMNDTY